MSAYVVAGRDLGPFVSEWLADVALDEEQQAELDASAVPAEGDDFDSRYVFNATYLYSQIGPRAAAPESTAEELLLAAVLAVYQQEHPMYRGPQWTTQADHVSRAFKLAHDCGDSAMAQRLIDEVIRRGEDRPEGWQIIQSSNAQTNPAKAAFWDGKMAELEQRELRAAALFDPTVDFDRILLDPGRG